MKIDRIGMKYGSLVVVGWSHAVYRSPRQGSYQFWVCRCNCGNSTIVLANNLARGNTASCGCKSSRHTLGERISTHNKTKTGTYKSWCAMKSRCYCKTHIEYKRYGAVGIQVCERWRNSFENFLQDLGERPEGMSLERKDSNKNYSPSNCKWADVYEQANNRSNNRLIACDGETQTLAQWSRQLGIGATTISLRIKRGWSIERALNFKENGNEHF